MSRRNRPLAKRWRRLVREGHAEEIQFQLDRQRVWRWSRLAASLAGHPVHPDPPNRHARRHR